jgi:hypothetical protein
MPGKQEVKKSSTFEFDLEFGKVGERWVESLLGGDFSVEVKSDRMAHKTGNVFIEIYYKDRPSGISTTQAQYWVYRIDEMDAAIILPVEKLKEIVKEVYKANGLKNAGEYSKGVLIPISRLYKQST